MARGETLLFRLLVAAPTPQRAMWIEEHLNIRIGKGEKLTPKTQIIDVDRRGVDHIINKLKALAKFEGRNYLLRHYGNKLLKTLSTTTISKSG